MDTSSKQQNQTPMYWLTGAIVVVLVFFAARSWNWPFLEGWDDNLYVTGNAHLSASWYHVGYWLTETCVGNWQPLTMWSFMVDQLIWPDWAMGYRLQNLLYFGLALGFGASCCIRLGLDWRVATVLILLFGLHPQRVESTLWVSERKDVLCAAFYAASLYYWLRGEREFRNWRALICFVLALLAKPMAVSLPCVMVCIVLAHSRSRRHFWAAAVRVWPYVLVAGVMVPMAIWAQGDAIQEAGSVGERFVVVWRNLFWYPFTLVWPADLSPIYPIVDTSSAVVPCVISTVVFLLLVCLALRFEPIATQRILVPGVLAYGCVLLPVSGIVPLGAIHYADRYALITGFILAYTGFRFVAAVLRRRRLLVDPRIAFAVVVIGAVVLGIETWRYAPAFSSIHALMTRAASAPDAGHVALGQAAELQIEAGNLAEAKVLIDRLAAYSPNTLPDGVRAGVGLRLRFLQGVYANAMGDHPEAQRKLSALLAEVGTVSVGSIFSRKTAMITLMNSASAQGDRATAAAVAIRVLQIDPRQPQALLILDPSAVPDQ